MFTGAIWRAISPQERPFEKLVPDESPQIGREALYFSMLLEFLVGIGISGAPARDPCFKLLEGEENGHPNRNRPGELGGHGS